MKRSKNETEVVEDQVSDTSEDTSDDAAKAAEFDAATEASRDPFYAVFNVLAATVLNSPAQKEHGEAVTFTVTRQRKGSYVASLGDATGRESRKVDVAVRRAIEAMGMRDAEFTYDAKAAESEQAPIPDSAGGNAPPEVWFFDEESEISSRLRAVEENVRAADVLLTGAHTNTREGWLNFGAAYNDAKAIFAEAGLTVFSDDGKSETAKRGNTAWGTWLGTRFGGSENVEKILESKNAAAQAGFYATAPKNVIDVFPSVNTASTFERKTNEITASFSEAVAQKILTARVDAGNDSKELTASEAIEVAVKKQAKNVEDYNAAFEAWQKDAAEKAKKEKAVPAFAKAREEAGNVVIAWLLSTESGQRKLSDRIATAWKDEIEKPSEEEAEKEAAEKATKAIKKAFAEMSVEAAAIHLLAILVSHNEAEDVYATLGDKLEDALAAKAKAAADAKSKAEEEAANA